MRPILIFTGLFALALFSGCKASKQPRAQLKHPGQLIFNGYVTAKADCFGCHGANGRGATWGPSLAKTPRFTDKALVRIIDEGPGPMGAYKNVLTAEQKKEVINWLRESFGAFKKK